MTAIGRPRRVPLVRRTAGIGATLSPKQVPAKVRNPPIGADPAGYGERQRWGMKSGSGRQG